MRPVTPRGFRDVLPREADEREGIVRAVSDVMSAWGYGPVETPVAEEFATLQAGAGSSVEDALFRLFDSDGRLLALRPEMTVPIARLAATRLSPEHSPFRLRYAAEVFREQSSLRGQARQFSQVGLELIGAGGPVADAEVIAVMVESLRAAGLVDFSVGVGTVGVLRSITDSAGMDAAWGAEVFSAAHARNLVAIDELAERPGVEPRAAAALRAVPRIRGARAAIDECRTAAGGCPGAGDALDALEETWELLDVLGVTDAVSIDLGVMRSFDYYVGIVIEAYAAGLGLPVGGGGRYDGVMTEFGAPMPAAGFAIGVERLHIALAEQGVTLPAPELYAVVGGEPRHALREAAVLRASGRRVCLSERRGKDLAAEARERGALNALEAGPDGVAGVGSDAGVETGPEDAL